MNVKLNGHPLNKTHLIIIYYEWNPVPGSISVLWPLLPKVQNITLSNDFGMENIKCCSATFSQIFIDIQMTFWPISTYSFSIHLALRRKRNMVFSEPLRYSHEILFLSEFSGTKKGISSQIRQVELGLMVPILMNWIINTDWIWQWKKIESSKRSCI